MTSMAVVYKRQAVSKVDGMTFVLSDETPDRHGDIVKADGWDLADFNKNPIALFGHNSNFMVGSWKDVRVEKAQLLGELVPAPKGTSERADEIIRFAEAGVLKAVSVGFVPIERKIRRGPDQEFEGFTFTKQALVECSLCAVGANPNALAVAKALNLSSDARKLVFAEHGVTDRPVQHDHIGEYAKLFEPDRWSPEEARRAKALLLHLDKQHPLNRLYHKLWRLMDEVECVRTIVAEHGKTTRSA
jgi:HK97 family phage prohead protease